MSSSTPQSSPQPADDPRPSAPGTPEEHKAAPVRRGWRRFAWMFGWTGLVAILVLGAGFAGAEYYTGRPQFCGSCHVMDPYYETWSHDLHGAKLGAKCIDCHYAPGERLTFMAKFKGLSQVASYFSGRYGAGRPRAHVSDDSCLRSGCHGDGAHRDKLLPVGEPRKELRIVGGVQTEVMRQPTVHFRHSSHQDIEPTLQKVLADLQTARQALHGRLPGDAFGRLELAVRSVAPAGQRTQELTSLLAELQLDEPARAAAQQWADLEHRAIRLRQLEGLNCSSCHNFDPLGKNHIAVNRNACFTCHFANEQFNHATAECLKCHEPPTRAVQVHGTTATTSAEVMMDHQDIVRKGIDPRELPFFDVVRGETTVSERECRHCHDQDRFLAAFAGRTTTTVAEYHAVHVAGQKARCEDCHRSIDHSLLHAERVASSSKFLEPVLNDCQHCHPSHHSEQVHLLLGTGGTGIEHPMPNAMMGSRLNCRACHTQAGEDFKGDALVKATATACVRCHSPEYAEMFDQWGSELQSLLAEVSARHEKLAAVLAEGQAAGVTPNQEVQRLAGDALRNIGLVRTGGGLHNKPYAVQLLETARLQLDEADRRHGRVGGP